MNTNLSPQKALAAGLSMLVLIVIAIGVYMTGSPAKARREQLDQQRVNAMQQIASAVDSTYANAGVMPATLEELALRSKEIGWAHLEPLTDPVTGQPYEYRVVSASKYEVCAAFDAPTPEGRDAYGNPRPPRPVGAPVIPGERKWDHPAGYHCFSLDASDGIPTVACSITNPCIAPNTTCAKLPNRGTFCVPQGLECKAAGCAGTCTLAESFPVQVSCLDDGNPVPPPHPEEEITAEEPRPITCNLMRSKESGAMGCFGCGSQICNKPGPEWEHYEQAEGTMGIPYACYDDEDGKCALAQ